MNEFRKILESPTLLINTLSKQMVAEGKEIYKFGFGQSPFNPPGDVIKMLSDNSHRSEYTHVQGQHDLRELISSFHFDAHQIESNPDHIFVGPGSKILIYSILLAHKNADVFLPAPSWVSYNPQVLLSGHHPIFLDTKFEERWRVTPDIIESAARFKKFKNSILILNYPGNPDGLTYSKEEIQSLTEICRKLDILVISDEIYSLINFDDSHNSFAKFYPEKTITATGLSKWCGCGGWRFGVALFPNEINNEFLKAIVGIASETYSCTSTPIQIAAKTAYESFENRKPYIKRQVDILKKLSDFVFQELSASIIGLHKPQGAFYLFPDFSEYSDKLLRNNISSSVKLCETLLSETGVALLPGTAFGMPKEKMLARLAYVDFNDPMDSDKFDIKIDSPKVYNGVKLLSEWLSSL